MTRTMLGTVALAVPGDWTEVKRDSERVILRSRRLFSGYVLAKDASIITIYLEAFGISPQQHLASFKAFVTGKL